MIRYGIVGFGLHAVRRLMPGFALARNSRVTALSRRDLQKARASAAEYNIPHAFNSAADLCRSPEVDAVFVATPDSAHLNDVLLAVECGKPVLCEKPMGMNADECRRMVEAARRANLLLGVAHVFRFENSVASFRRRVASGEIGQPVYARSEFSYIGRNHPRAWLYDSAVACGGPIADVGVHCIDTLRYILDDEVVRVSAAAASTPQSGSLEAAAVLSLEFARGGLGSVIVSTLVDYRTPLEIVGENGSLRADDALNVERPIELELRRNGKVVESETVSNLDAYARQVDDFASAIEGKQQFPAPGEQGWQNQEILDAAYRSLKSGRTESVPQVGAH
ncbi:MAG TPA: Gfo/Idh/MocA family oxidoreductase [Verrucomicrobiae bacterium]|nr:Gfo/Idh/MocA family oxidoreductase [Verrucomicrobiae bacterium]